MSDLINKNIITCVRATFSSGRTYTNRLPTGLPLSHPWRILCSSWLPSPSSLWSFCDNACLDIYSVRGQQRLNYRLIKKLRRSIRRRLSFPHPQVSLYCSRPSSRPCLLPLLYSSMMIPCHPSARTRLYRLERMLRMALYGCISDQP